MRATDRRWKRAVTCGMQWRYLLVFAAGTLLPSALALGPMLGFLQDLFDHSTRARELVARLDSPALFEVLRQLGEPAAAAVMPGITGAILSALIIAPALAGAAATVAESKDRPNLTALLNGAGRFYLRMLRTTLTSLVPMGLAGAAAFGILHAVGKAKPHVLLESTASRHSLLGWLTAVVLLWLAQSTVEAGRAFLVAEPERRSAFLAWWKGARFTARHPLQVLAMCAGTTLAALVVAALLTSIRLRLFSHRGRGDRGRICPRAGRPSSRSRGAALAAWRVSSRSFG